MRQSELFGYKLDVVSAFEEPAEELGPLLPCKINGASCPQNVEDCDIRGALQSLLRVGIQVPVGVDYPDGPQRLVTGTNGDGQTVHRRTDPFNAHGAAGPEHAGVLTGILRQVGNLAAQNSVPPVVVDRLVGKGGVCENLFLEVFDGGGTTYQCGNGVGQGKQVTYSQR